MGGVKIRSRPIRWAPLSMALTAALSALPVAGLGQVLYRDVTDTRIPTLVGPCLDAAAGDVDGDGDIDIALAMEFYRNLLMINQGGGRFVIAGSQSMPVSAHDSEEVDLADFDGDGDLDMLFVSEDDRTNEFFLQIEPGSYVNSSYRIGPEGTSNSHAVLDLDNDGDLDILIGNIGVNRVLINDGNANFSDETDTRWVNSGRTQDIELADVDNDGDLDVITANEGQNELFLNNGEGVLILAAENLPEIDDESREIRAVDVDGDRDLDLLVANVQFARTTSQQDYFLLNNGDGVFTEVPANYYPAGERNHFTLQVVDLDHDGDMDVILPHSEITRVGGNVISLLNDGTGVFTEADESGPLPRPLYGNSFDIEVADFNGDGHDDLFFCNRAANRRGDNRRDGQSRLLIWQPPG